MNELDESVQVFRRDGVVLLIEIVYVSVENLHEKLDRNSCVHTGIGDTQSTLKTFENALAVSVGLVALANISSRVGYIDLPLYRLPASRPSQLPTRGDWQDTQRDIGPAS